MATTKRRVRFLLLTSSLIALGSCGEPAGPSATAWTEVALGPGVTYIAEARDGVYAIQSRSIYSYDPELGGGSVPAIIKFNGYVWADEYVGDDITAELKSLGFWEQPGYGIIGWAVGSKGGIMDTKPLLLKYETGGLSGGSWEEVDIDQEGVGALDAVYPIGASECWVIGGSGRLYKFDGERFTREVNFPHVRAGAYDRRNNLFMVYGKGPASEDKIIYITPDGGGTWFSENPAFNAYGFTVNYLLPGNAENGAMYFGVQFDDMRFSAIVRRTGAPGQGKYDLCFFGGVSGSIHDIKSVATDAKGNAVGVGAEGSVYYDGSTWRVEDLPYRIGFRQVIPAAEGGFWGLGENLVVMGRKELLFHP